MIEAGDKVMVCLSGGKDSYALLDILLQLKKRAPFPFEVIAVNLDQKQPGFPADILPRYLTELGVPFHIETQDTYSIVTRVLEEARPCARSVRRLRRGILYRVASELGATKIALGHHRDDILGTFFLNLFYGGKTKGMPPKLVSDDGRHTVIRPLAYVPESDLIAYAELKQFPIIPCNLCGSQENLKRKEVGRMIQEWDRKHPPLVERVQRAVARGALAPDGPRSVRLRGAQAHGRARCQWRYRVRRGGSGRGRHVLRRYAASRGTRRHCRTEDRLFPQLMRRRT